MTFLRKFAMWLVWDSPSWLWMPAWLPPRLFGFAIGSKGERIK